MKLGFLNRGNRYFGFHEVNDVAKFWTQANFIQFQNLEIVAVVFFIPFFRGTYFLVSRQFRCYVTRGKRSIPIRQNGTRRLCELFFYHR